MKVHVGDPEFKSSYRVEVRGYIGQFGGTTVRHALYCGESKELARVHLLQAQALSQAFPYGRAEDLNYSYAKHAQAARARLGKAADVGVGSQWLEVGYSVR